MVEDTHLQALLDENDTRSQTKLADWLLDTKTASNMRLHITGKVRTFENGCPTS